MPRYDVRSKQPEHYARVRAQQEELHKRYFEPGVMIARICPFCGFKVEMLCRGYHAPVQLKCSNCGEEIVFPPVQFRTQRCCGWTYKS